MTENNTKTIGSNYTAKGCEPHEHKQNTGNTDMNNDTESGRVSTPLQQELGTTSDKPIKKWKCKDCGGTENQDHRGCNLMFKEKPRFYVDERAGCIAVRDRTKDDKWFSGLSEDTEGVRGYWTGVRQEDEKGNFKQWCVFDSQRKEADALCDLLNAGV